LGELGSINPLNILEVEVSIFEVFQKTPTISVVTPLCAAGYNFLPFSRNTVPAGHVNAVAPVTFAAREPVV
jgi:hypothetical protein